MTFVVGAPRRARRGALRHRVDPGPLRGRRPPGRGHRERRAGRAGRRARRAAGACGWTSGSGPPCSRWCSTASCRCCATPSRGSQGVDRRWSRPAAVSACPPRRAGAHRAAARGAGDHGRRAHRAGAAGRRGQPRHVHRAGGLGEMITTGISLFRFSLMVAGALLVALLALLIEWLGGPLLRSVARIAPRATR